jgi:hypothetical protein
MKRHPILTWLDSKTLLEELEGSKRAIEHLTGNDEIHFAYPDGIFSDRELEAVQKVGYAGGVQTFRCPERSGPFAMPRTGLTTRSTTGFRGHFSRARMEVTLGGFTKRRLTFFLRSLLARA